MTLVPSEPLATPGRAVARQQGRSSALAAVPQSEWNDRDARSGANGQRQAQVAGSGQASSPGAGGARSEAATESQGARGAGGNGPPDFQRLVSRLPKSTLADLQKGDAVMIVSTEGGSSDAVTAITMLAGVDAILTAAPNRSASSLLSPWSLGAAGGEGEGAP